MTKKSDAIAAAQAHLGGAAGEKGGESGDGPSAEAGDKAGEFTRQTYTLDQIQRDALFDARADDRTNKTGGDGEVAFWRAAGDRLGFNPITVEPAEDIAESGLFTAYPADDGQIDETPVEPATMAALGRVGEDVKLDTRSLVSGLRDGILEFVKRLPKPWGITPFDQQRDTAAAAEQVAQDFIRQIVEAVVADGRTTIRALLVKYDEGDDIKVTLKVKAIGTAELEDAVIGLHRARGKHVLISVASVSDYDEQQREAELQPDQPGLEFEAGPIDEE